MRSGLVVIAACALALGCGGSPGAKGPPQQAVSAYVRALEGGNYAGAYDLMSDSYRRSHSRADFVRLLRENPDEAREMARRLRQRASAVELKAGFEYGLGERFDLVVEGGSWRIATDPLDFYSQRSPRNALRTFIRAVKRKRWDIVLRLVPSRWASQMTVERIRGDFEGDRRSDREQMMERLAGHVNDRIEMIGPDAAIMRYGEKYEMEFAREQGAWKIVDPD